MWWTCLPSLKVKRRKEPYSPQVATAMLVHSHHLPVTTLYEHVLQMQLVEKAQQLQVAQAMKRDKSATHHKYRVTSDSLMIGAPRPDQQAEERLSRLSPRKLKLLATFHGIFTGHHGWRQTLELLRVHGHFWKDIEKDVRNYVKNCHMSKDSSLC